MSNMHYCRFQNTLADLRDCYDALNENNEIYEGLSEEETRAAKRLLILCDRIAEDFEYEIEYLEKPKEPKP